MIQLLDLNYKSLKMQDRYEILESKSNNLLKARTLDSKNTVMIKKVSFSSISSKKKEHIVNEVNTFIHMDYIHLLRYLDFQINKKDLTVDIVMEYCEGGTLQDLISKLKLQNKRLEENEVWKIFYQLIQALDYIHRDGIIHRNINPTNIYFRESQKKNIKLGGFNFIKKIDFKDSLEETVLPNTYYLSPEQIETGVCTRQTDIWALGCLMYQLCTLQSPFRHANEFERVRMIKESRPDKIKSYSSVQLKRLIFWCLDKSPENRPSIESLLSAPEISLRIRERRYQERLTQLQVKQQYLSKKEKELQQKEKELFLQQKIMKRYESLKKKNSELESMKKKSSELVSSKNLTYLKGF